MPPQGILATHFAGRMPRVTTVAAGSVGVLRLRHSIRFANGMAPLRGCDFFDFPQNPMLKTNSLQTEKRKKFNKVTNSQDDNLWKAASAHSRFCLAGVESSEARIM